MYMYQERLSFFTGGKTPFTIRDKGKTRRRDKETEAEKHTEKAKATLDLENSMTARFILLLCTAGKAPVVSD